jgi:hypothetical protein
MTSAIEHEATIEIVKAQTAGTAPALLDAMLALIEGLRARVTEEDEEVAYLRRVEAAAERAHDYHRSGKFNDPEYDDEWDARIMVERLDELGEALSS